MPLFKFQLARRLTLVAGITRSRLPELEQMKKQARSLRKARQRIKEQKGQIRRLQHAQTTQPTNIAVRPENIVWVFGTARTGSTWLGAMMSSLEGHWWWREPRLGQLFGSALRRHEQVSSIKSSYRDQWARRIRSIVLGAATVSFSSRSRRM